MLSKVALVRVSRAAALAVSLQLALPVHGESAVPDASARRLAERAAEGMGGVERLRSLQSVKLQAIGQRFMREQSERPEGPWTIDYFQISELRDLQHSRLRQERQSRGCDSTPCWKSAQWSSSVNVVADGVAAVIRDGKAEADAPSAVQDAAERLAFSPERVLLHALEARDLRMERDTDFHGFKHHVLAFTYRDTPARLLVSSQSGMLAAVEWTRPRPYDLYWSGWGDITTRITYGYWMLEPGGLHYPRAWTAESNGQPDWSSMINELTLDAPASVSDFALPENVRADFARERRTLDEWQLPSSPEAVRQLAPGVVQIAGLWNVAHVRQGDGIVIIEAPISNGYSRQVLQDARKRFPGVPIKAVISTSDAWPHIAGLREYVAAGIPVYALDMNRPILERLLAAPHRLREDALASAPRAAQVVYISGRTTLGSGANRLELIPFRTVSGERMLAVYLPEHKLLYCSDLIQRSRNGTFPILQWSDEATRMQQRERLEVRSAFGMHLGPTDWQVIAAEVRKQSGD